MVDASTPLVAKDKEGGGGGGSGKIPLLPPAVAVPVEGALSAVGGLTRGWLSQLVERGRGLATGARPWLEFFDLSAMGRARGGMDEYFARFRSNLRYYFLNYLLVR